MEVNAGPNRAWIARQEQSAVTVLLTYVLVAAFLARCCTVTGARLGTYGPIKAALGGDKDHVSVLRNIVAGCLSGSFAAAVTNPIDLIKTRLQARNSPFNSAAQVVRFVVQEQGVTGLWTGTTPSVVRCSPACTRPFLLLAHWNQTLFP